MPGGARGALRALALAQAGLGAAAGAAGAAGAARAWAGAGGRGGWGALWFPLAAGGAGAALLANGLLGCCCGTASRQCWFDPFAFFTLVALFGESVVWVLLAAAPEALHRLAGKDATGLIGSALDWAGAHRSGAQALLGVVAAVLGSAFLLSWTVRTCCADLEDYDDDEDLEEGDMEGQAALRRAGQFGRRYRSRARGYAALRAEDSPPTTPEFPPRRMRFYRSPLRSPNRATVVPQEYDSAAGTPQTVSPSLTHPLVEPVAPTTVSPLRPHPSFFRSAQVMPRGAAVVAPVASPLS